MGLQESLKFATNILILILEHIFLKEIFIIDGFEPKKYPIIVFIGDNYRHLV